MSQAATIIAIPDDVWTIDHIVLPASQLPAAEAAAKEAGATVRVLEAIDKVAEPVTAV